MQELAARHARWRDAPVAPTPAAVAPAAAALAARGAAAACLARGISGRGWCRQRCAHHAPAAGAWQVCCVSRVAGTVAGAPSTRCSGCSAGGGCWRAARLLLRLRCGSSR
eukprot:192280-Chlamydomonas_euryale.AAC.1